MDSVDSYSYPNPYNDPTLPGYRPETTNVREKSSSFVTAENKHNVSGVLKPDSSALRIFISYSSKDVQIAEQIEKYLQQQKKEDFIHGVIKEELNQIGPMK